jgi:hypothetical protein
VVLPEPEAPKIAHDCPAATAKSIALNISICCSPSCSALVKLCAESANVFAVVIGAAYQCVRALCAADYRQGFGGCQCGIGIALPDAHLIVPKMRIHFKVLLNAATYHLCASCMSHAGRKYLRTGNCAKITA